MRFESREEASVDLRRPYCPAPGSLMGLESCSLIVSVPASCIPRGVPQFMLNLFPAQWGLTLHQ